MAAAIEKSFNTVFTIKHIKESNMIEGILTEPTDGEFVEWNRFLALDEITVDDLKRNVYINAGAGHRLRNLITDHHQIGERTMIGGPRVEIRLKRLLDMINIEEMLNPWNAHIEFELLHPFTDGNGRAGRMIWHWMMKRKFKGQYVAMTSIGFLHRFYYQSMQYNKDGVL